MSEFFIIRYADRTWSVRTEVPLLGAWVDWAEPFAELSLPEDRPADIVIVRRELEPAPPGARQVVLHGELPGLAWEEDGCLHVRGLESDAGYMWTREERREGGGLLTLAYGPAMPDHEAALDAFRVVRGLVCADSEFTGRSRAHMSVVAREGRAVAFVGDKGAGKTSFALSILRADPSVAFLANDKAQVEPVGTSLRVHGLPLAAAVSIDSIPDVPEITLNSYSRIIENKVYLWPLQLASILSRQCVPSALLDLVCFCELDLRAASVIVGPIEPDEIADLISGPVSQYTDRINPDWLIRHVYGTVPRRPPDALTHARWVRLQGNPWTPSWPVVFNSLLVGRSSAC